MGRMKDILIDQQEANTCNSRYNKWTPELDEKVAFHLEQKHAMEIFTKEQDRLARQAMYMDKISTFLYYLILAIACMGLGSMFVRLFL